MMKKILTCIIAAVTLLALVSLAGCNTEGENNGRSAMYSDTNTPLLENVVFYISPYLLDGDTKRYIVTEKLENLILKINDTERAPADSYELNVADMNGVTIVDGFRTTTQKLRYPFRINVEVSISGTATAGEYADLVRNKLNLTPGSYLCQISRFEFYKSEGASFAELHKVESPFLWTTLDVEEGRTSISIGEYEVNIR